MKRAKKIERLLLKYEVAGMRYREQEELRRSGAYSGAQGARLAEEAEAALEEAEGAWRKLLDAIRAVPD